MDRLICGNVNSFTGFMPNAAYDAFERLGITYLEVPSAIGMPLVAPELMDASDLERLRAGFERRGLTPITATIYADLNRDVHVPLAKRRIDFAREIGATYVITDATRAQLDRAGLERLYNTIRHLGDYAGKREIVVCLDVHGGLTSTGRRCLEVMEAVKHPHVRVNYDPANIVYHNEEPIDVVEDLKLIAPYVAHFHLKDTAGGYHEWNFPALGEGTIDFPAIFKVLDDHGFQGPLSLEIEGVRGEDLNRAGNFDRLKRSLEYLERIGVV